MVVPSILNPFFTSLVDSIENALHAQGRQLFLCDSRLDPRIEAEHLRQLVSRHVDGIVVSLCHATGSVQAVTESARAVPLVQLDRRVEVPGTDWVVLDDDEAMRLVVTHLHEQGVRSAAFVTSEMTNSSTDLRLRGSNGTPTGSGLRTGQSGSFSASTRWRPGNGQSGTSSPAGPSRRRSCAPMT